MTSKKELQRQLDEISSWIDESSSISAHIKDNQLLDKIKELVLDRKNWVLYALDNEAAASKYRQAIVHVLSIPERTWTKEKISIILKQALEE